MMDNVQNCDSCYYDTNQVRLAHVSKRLVFGYRELFSYLIV
jgi:hypothetical protein